MIAELVSVCKFCLFDGFYLFYAVFVFAVSVLASRAGQTRLAAAAASDRGRLPPIPGGELPFPIIRNPPKTSVVADLFTFTVELASLSFFQRIMRSGIEFIRTIFLQRDNPTVLRSFWRYLNIYYLVIVLPAAFMPPVGHPQRAPDFHLLAAVVLLICINALGDVLSVRIILNIFKRLEERQLTGPAPDDVWSRFGKEAAYYLAIIIGGACCLLVLAAVLICSSILYGVQIGQMDFGVSYDFFRNAWDRALRFPELASTLYWFRDRPGPFGWDGIPGLFLYGLTTFIPVIVLTVLAALWLFLIPFRIAVNLPAATPAVVRVISAEAAVFGICVVVSLAMGRFLWA